MLRYFSQFANICKIPGLISPASIKLQNPTKSGITDLLFSAAPEEEKGIKVKIVVCWRRKNNFSYHSRSLHAICILLIVSGNSCKKGFHP